MRVHGFSLLQTLPSQRYQRNSLQSTSPLGLHRMSRLDRREGVLASRSEAAGAMRLRHQSDPVREKLGLHHVRLLRVQLGHLQDFGKTCDRAKGLLERTLGAHGRHLVAGTELYSLNDLCALERGELIPRLQKVVDTVAKHITKDCSRCAGHGFVCELCNDRVPFFAFDIQRAIQCRRCATFFHRQCWRRRKLNEHSCPRCLRIKRRARSMADGVEQDPRGRPRKLQNVRFHVFFSAPLLPPALLESIASRTSALVKGRRASRAPCPLSTSAIASDVFSFKHTSNISLRLYRCFVLTAEESDKRAKISQRAGRALEPPPSLVGLERKDNNTFTRPRR